MNICIYKHHARVEVTVKILERYEEAFVGLGHNVMAFSYEAHRFSPERARSFAQEFMHFSADLAFCYGFSAMPRINGSYFFRKRGIPLVVLLFENPFFGLSDEILEEIKSHSDYYYLFVWDEFYLELLSKHVNHCYPIRHAARIRKEDRPEADRGFKRELAFVGNVPETPRVGYNEGGYEKKISDLVDGFITRKLADSKANIIQFLSERKFAGSRDNGFIEKPSFHQEVIYPVHVEGLGRYRKAVLDQLGMFKVHYYGGGSWEAPHVVFAGHVSYMDDLPDIYASSVVNLDIPPFQSINSLSNRVFDALGSRALVLTEAKHELKEVFNNHEMIEYRSIGDLIEKIRFYLSSSTAREEIVEKLHITICEAHTYEQRVRYITDVLSEEGIH